jgi:hypothetical protein
MNGIDLFSKLVRLLDYSVPKRLQLYDTTCKIEYLVGNLAIKCRMSRVPETKIFTDAESAAVQRQTDPAPDISL